MNWEAKDIRTNFFGIITDSKKMNKAELEKKYSTFILDNEKLYSVAVESVVSGKVQESIKMLDTMLATREKVRNGVMNNMTASMFIGNQLGHKYIFPETGVPSVEDFKYAIDKIKEGGIDIKTNQ
jgi:hypothetical protein